MDYRPCIPANTFGHPLPENEGVRPQKLPSPPPLAAARPGTKQIGGLSGVDKGAEGAEAPPPETPGALSGSMILTICHGISRHAKTESFYLQRQVRQHITDFELVLALITFISTFTTAV